MAERVQSRNQWNLIMLKLRLMKWDTQLADQHRTCQNHHNTLLASIVTCHEGSPPPHCGGLDDDDGVIV